MNPIKILICDDQQLVREALTALLSLEPDIEVTGNFGSGIEVLSAVAKLTPDVVLLDIEMPDLSGIEVVSRLKAQGYAGRCIMVTTFGRPGYLQRALDAGASGFVVKDTPAAQLAEAIRKVHRGLRVVDPTLATESLFSGNNPLTDREKEVLRLAVRGQSVKEISRALSLSQGTVRMYC